MRPPSRVGMETCPFSFWLSRSRLRIRSSASGIGSTSVTIGLAGGDVDAGCHIGRDPLLFWPELEDVSIHQVLNPVHEDAATPSGVTYHLMVHEVL